MAIAVAQLDGQIFVLFGTSSAQIVVNKLNQSRLEQVCVDSPAAAAILSMKRVSFSFGKRILILCGLTNGTIVVYELSKTGSLKLLSEFKEAHEFGVNCLDAIKYDESSILSVSGGDD